MTGPEQYRELSPETRDLIARTEELVARYPDSVVYDIPEDGNYDHRCIDLALLTVAVCTRLTPAEAAQWYTTVRPPGAFLNRWEVAEGVGSVACQQFPATHRHVFVVC